MSTNVYANARSIACKAGPGLSPAAFPDVCWTPPQPAPIPIPYPNTSFSVDLANGTRTVFIHGTEIARKDASFFATSTGDEGATPACGQGIITGVIKGKAYFSSWSMNVKAEGLNVCRHLDLMGHNHASQPSNTAHFPFLELSWYSSDPCKKERERIERACKKEDEEQDETKKKMKPKKRSLFGKLAKLKGKVPAKRGPWNWTHDHCDGLQISPNAADAKAFLDELKNAYKELFDQQRLLDAAKAELYDYLQGAAMKAGAKVLAKAGVKQLGGSSLPLIGNIAMGLWTAYDVYSAVSSIGDLRALFNDLVEYLDVLKQKLGDFKSILERYNKEGGSAALMADVMDALATINPCTRARKCVLVPYSRGAGNSKSTGCCPGQTGHHLVPGAMARKVCSAYKHEDAPTVCVEGANQHHGSHGRVHDAMDGYLRGGIKVGTVKNGKISKENAMHLAAWSLVTAFPLSRCSVKCIQAQLETYYGKVCGRAPLDAVDKQGKLVTEDTEGDTGAH